MRYSEASLKEEVRKRRIIWDYSKKSHANKNLVDKAFKDIADLYSDAEIDGKYSEMLVQVLFVRLVG